MTRECLYSLLCTLYIYLKSHAFGFSWSTHIEWQICIHFHSMEERREVCFCCTFSRHAVKTITCFKCQGLGQHWVKAVQRGRNSLLWGKWVINIPAETAVLPLMPLSPKKPLCHITSIMTCCMNCLLLNSLLDCITSNEFHLKQIQCLPVHFNH